MAISCLDWVEFEGYESWVLGNWLGPTGIFTDEVYAIGDWEAGALVFKVGRGTAQAPGMVNNVTVVIWEDGGVR
ncbi:hypothetical protein HOY80DRAFT_1044000 [Tuber brumale]|nr:hypothetical protein HOY80DRAFT_1044000 [Tuber brumale]